MVDHSECYWLLVGREVMIASSQSPLRADHLGGDRAWSSSTIWTIVTATANILIRVNRDREGQERRTAVGLLLAAKRYGIQQVS